MSRPDQSGCNLVGCHVYPIADLGMSAVVTSVENVASDVVHSGAPALVHAISKLTSGSGNLKLDKAATAAAVAFSSPDVTLACSGTSEQSCSLNTTSGELYFGFEQSSASTCTWNQLAFFVLYELVPGNIPAEIKAAHNLVMNGSNSVQAGSGAITLTIA